MYVCVCVCLCVCVCVCVCAAFSFLAGFRPNQQMVADNQIFVIFTQWSSKTPVNFFLNKVIFIFWMKNTLCNGILQNNPTF